MAEQTQCDWQTELEPYAEIIRAAHRAVQQRLDGLSAEDLIKAFEATLQVNSTNCSWQTWDAAEMVNLSVKSLSQARRLGYSKGRTLSANEKEQWEAYCGEVSDAELGGLGSKAA